MDRTAGVPLGAATQSTGRPMPENGQTQRAAPSATVRRFPNNSVDRHGPSNGSSSSNYAPLSANQVVALAQEAMKNALAENETKAAEASGVSNDLKPGVTIDLSHKNIQKFPEEVVDIIKTELERLALSHNMISSFPARFAECSSLRYLNVRNNVIREFPLAICELTSLEILDLGRNKLRFLPPELAKLSSLKVLSIQKNRIEDLPLCLADMASLQVLKLEGNPIRFPPKEILYPQATTPPNGGILKESEMADVTVTAQIKRFLKQKAIVDRSETESGGEESSEGPETPRPAFKRVTSGRFPIKVNGAEVPDLRSPALPRGRIPPSRSHYRGLSQQNAALRHPGVMPLAIANSERLRSNSESQSQSRARRDPSADPSRRMGLVTRKQSDLGTVDESMLNRLSYHYRGLSHGSAGNSRSPASPADASFLRAGYVRRLSSLPERKRQSTKYDPVIEGAKGILFALFQIHPLISILIGLTRDGNDKRSSLEAVFYNASTHVDELDRDIQEYDSYTEEDEQGHPRSNETVHSACLTCVSAYIHVCSLLSRHVEVLLVNGDPRYIRALLLYVYGSICEVRNASTSLFAGDVKEVPKIVPSSGDTLRPPVKDRMMSLSETSVRQPRSRSATQVQHTPGLRVATNGPPPFLNVNSRSNTMVSSVTATPRSGESFASSNNSRGMGDFNEEDRVFDGIFLHLQQSSELAIMTLPNVHTHFVSAMKTNIRHGNMDLSRQYWQLLSQKCSVALQSAEALKNRLSLIKLKEPGIRTQGAFWELCNTFINAYTDLALKIREIRENKSMTKGLPTEVIELLRPLHKIVLKTSKLIEASPWSFLATSAQSNGSHHGGSFGSQSSASQMTLPMTPASAALGPAVQATVPSTPMSASTNALFSSNVFERADALLSMNNSIASSRNGTMTSYSSMVPSDGLITPASTLSPMNTLNNGTRFGQKQMI